jgi:hypothetical protein
MAGNGRETDRAPPSHHHQRPTLRPDREEKAVIALGVILLVLGLIFNIGILWTIGVILLVIGLILFLLGSVGHAVAGRRHYW